MHGIEAQQMRIGLHRRKIIDGDNRDVLAAGLRDRSQHIAADAAEAIDGDAN